jgi:ergothioneine biosynthesis protein EgtB
MNTMARQAGQTRPNGPALAGAAALPQAGQASDALTRYRAVRAQTEALAAPLSEEDCQVQSMPDASPTKWHLAHVSWFFETFILERHEPGFRPHHPAFRVLYNSYYHGIGAQHPRPQRGLVTRPSLAEVRAYRAAVDERMAALLQRPGIAEDAAVLGLLELGLQHEQQHQELLLTDIKHLLSMNPLDPVYAPQWPLAPVVPVEPAWVPVEGGLVDIGHAGEGFAFDNETPRHRVHLAPFALARRLVTHGDWAAFIEDGGYEEPRWWLSAGWDWRGRQAQHLPLYWQRQGQGYTSFTLHGRVPIDPLTPITHISLYEADAYARWRSAVDGVALRLPTEAEWEHAAAGCFDTALAAGNFLDSRALHPMPLSRAHEGPLQMLGDVWEWTASAYQPYPGYRPWEGAAGEYNGKFMVDQHVLRGGSCATPRSHIRASYRNFFPADARWQFTGLRLVREAA